MAWALRQLNSIQDKSDNGNDFSDFSKNFARWLFEDHASAPKQLASFMLPRYLPRGDNTDLTLSLPARRVDFKHGRPWFSPASGVGGAQGISAHPARPDDAVLHALHPHHRTIHARLRHRTERTPPRHRGLRSGRHAGKPGLASRVH